MSQCWKIADYSLLLPHPMENKEYKLFPTVTCWHVSSTWFDTWIGNPQLNCLSCWSNYFNQCCTAPSSAERWWEVEIPGLSLFPVSDRHLCTEEQGKYKNSITANRGESIKEWEAGSHTDESLSLQQNPDTRHYKNIECSDELWRLIFMMMTCNCAI